jgi:hypothetical protein
MKTASRIFIALCALLFLHAAGPSAAPADSPGDSGKAAVQASPKAADKPLFSVSITRDGFSEGAPENENAIAIPGLRGPLPATAWMLAVGLLSLVGLRDRRPT